MKKFLVIGSIAIDNVVYANTFAKPGQTVYGDVFLSNIGGKGANQAAASHFLGGDVEFYGAIGDDDNGKRVKAFLDTIGVNNHLKISQKNTGIASITINTQSAENSIIIVAGANMDIWPEDIDKIDFSKYSYLLLQLENPVDTVIYAMKKAKEAGLTVILNPAPYHSLPNEAFPLIDFFIPNEHELEDFTKEQPGSLEDKCAYLLKQGVKRIIVTLGENGSYYCDEKQSFYKHALRVNAIDTTGAGDSYCGAFVTALSNGKSVSEAMDFATKASSLTVTKKGAIASLPHLEDLK